ncbi:MAG: LLM class flavin-dependent oxidoreductase, partial [Sphingobium sp.]
PEALARSTHSMRWDPLTLLPALAVVTRHIGLIGTASTTYNEPFNLARRLASLDQISGGRAGWNLVTSLGGGENFNLDKHVAHEQRYKQAQEFYDVITGLWDSWEDDAFIQDKASGRWVDPDKMHVLDHKGPFFSVKGPLNAPRPIQGYPVIAQAGSSDDGRELAARTAELIFTATPTIDHAIDFGTDISARLARYGRRRSDVRILPGVVVYLADDVAQAKRLYEERQSPGDKAAGLKTSSQWMDLGIDLSQQPLDEPLVLPDDIPETNTHRSRQKLFVEIIRRDKPTLRQLLQGMSGGGHRLVFGNAGDVADDFEHWFRSGAADGFNLMFPDLTYSVDRFIDEVVPELQRRGIFRKAYTGTTLRENLGLQRPANQLAETRHSSENERALR